MSVAGMCWAENSMIKVFSRHFYSSFIPLCCFAVVPAVLPVQLRCCSTFLPFLCLHVYLQFIIFNFIPFTGLFDVWWRDARVRRNGVEFVQVYRAKIRNWKSKKVVWPFIDFLWATQNFANVGFVPPTESSFLLWTIYCAKSIFVTLNINRQKGTS